MSPAPLQRGGHNSQSQGRSQYSQCNSGMGLLTPGDNEILNILNELDRDKLSQVEQEVEKCFSEENKQD